MKHYLPFQKFFILSILLVFSALPIKSQTISEVISEEDFLNYVNEQKPILPKLVEEEKYEEVLDCLEKILDNFKKLSKENQDKHKELEAELYFHLGCYYAEFGDPIDAVEYFDKAIALSSLAENKAKYEGYYNKLKEQEQFKEALKSAKSKESK